MYRILKILEILNENFQTRCRENILILKLSKLKISNHLIGSLFKFLPTFLAPIIKNLHSREKIRSIWWVRKCLTPLGFFKLLNHCFSETQNFSRLKNPLIRVGNWKWQENQSWNNKYDGFWKKFYNWERQASKWINITLSQINKTFF